MAHEARLAGAPIVTGDTKVVGRGAADRVFVTTSGIGVIPAGRNLAAASVRPGDVALVNGVLGNHGAAILAARGDIALSTTIVSDCQSLGQLIATVLAAAPGTVATRDAARGGLASALNERAAAPSNCPGSARVSLVAEGNVVATGGVETPMLRAGMVRFRRRQVPAYRFIYGEGRQVQAGSCDLVRHRCHNRRCINPEHPQTGSGR